MAIIDTNKSGKKGPDINKKKNKKKKYLKQESAKLFTFIFIKTIIFNTYSLN